MGERSSSNDNPGLESRLQTLSYVYPKNPDNWKSEAA